MNFWQDLEKLQKTTIVSFPQIIMPPDPDSQHTEKVDFILAGTQMSNIA